MSLQTNNLYLSTPSQVIPSPHLITQVVPPSSAFANHPCYPFARIAHHLVPVCCLHLTPSLSSAFPFPNFLYSAHILSGPFNFLPGLISASFVGLIYLSSRFECLRPHQSIISIFSFSLFVLTVFFSLTNNNNGTE